jgi:hypothetical protein
MPVQTGVHGGRVKQIDRTDAAALVDARIVGQHDRAGIIDFGDADDAGQRQLGLEVGTIRLDKAHRRS